MTDEQALEAATRIIVADAFLSTREDTLTVARALVAQEARARKLVEALTDATAHLAGAASAYRKYAKRHISQGKAEADAFFSTRVVDFEKAVGRAHAALAEGRGQS